MTGAPTTPRAILIVSGLSGAGKSTTMRTLEDSGWEVVDNVPLSLLNRFIATPPSPAQGDDSDRPLAIGIDSRTRGFDAARIVSRLAELRRQGGPVETLFLDASGAELERRYAETRRRHPLALDRPAADGIAQERELMAPLRAASDHVIDTTDMSASALQSAIRQRFDNDATTTITITSFGFARGLPRNADLVFDVRFLRNPHWETALRPLTGLDQAIGDYVRADPLFDAAFGQIATLLETLLPRYQAEGKAYVTVAFGCTGGRHRSVYFAEQIGERLRGKGFSLTMMHRNLESAPLDAYENRRQHGRGAH